MGRGPDRDTTPGDPGPPHREGLPGRHSLPGTHSGSFPGPLRSGPGRGVSISRRRQRSLRHGRVFQDPVAPLPFHARYPARDMAAISSRVCSSVLPPVSSIAVRPGSGGARGSSAISDPASVTDDPPGGRAKESPDGTERRWATSRSLESRGSFRGPRCVSSRLFLTGVQSAPGLLTGRTGSHPARPIWTVHSKELARLSGLTRNGDQCTHGSTCLCEIYLRRVSGVTCRMVYFLGD